MKISSYNINTFLIDGGTMFGVVPKALWNRQYPADENNMIPLDLRTLIIDHADRVTIIDTGFGNKQSEKFFSHFPVYGGLGLVEGLAKFGYKPTDVTDVIHTHLHYDHCGGGIGIDNKGEFYPIFPNAKYHVSQTQWDSALNPNIREATSFLPENILPMKELGLLNLVQNEGELIPGIEVRFFDGHTKGQMIPIVHLPNGKKVVFTADFFPSTAHIHPAWNASYDVEPLIAMKEKEDFLEEAFARGYYFFYQHDNYTECSNLQKTTRGIRAGEKMVLSEIV